MKKIVAVFGALLLASAAQAAQTTPETRDTPFDDHCAQVMARAAAVRVLRLKFDPTSADDSWMVHPEELASWPVQSSRESSEATVVSALARGLLEAKGYGPSTITETHSTNFVGDVAFRFLAPAGSCDVLVSFWVDEIIAHSRSAEGDSLNFAERSLGSSRDSVLEMAKQALPEDRDLQWRPPRRERARSAREFLGPAAAIVAGASRSEVFGVRGPGRVWELAELVIVKTRPQAAAFTKRLARVLLDDVTYDLGAYKPCAFKPNVAFRMSDGNGSCELILCLGCMQLIVNVQDHSGRPLYWALENLNGGPIAKLAEEALGKREVQRLVEEARKPPEH